MVTYSFKEVIARISDGESYISTNGRDIQIKIIKNDGIVAFEMYYNGELYMGKVCGFEIRDNTVFVKCLEMTGDVK